MKVFLPSAADGRTRRPTREGSVRPVGTLSSSGRVEVYHDGQWVQFVMTDGNCLKLRWCVVSWVSLEQYQLH